VYQELETSIDLTLEPDDVSEKAMTAEFQGYLSEPFISRSCCGVPCFASGIPGGQCVAT
jgi:hypothetical protein